MNILKMSLPYVKYPRTFHLPFSLGRTTDDRTLSDCTQFEGREVVITTKMDGENTTGYFNGYIHARSLDGRQHPSRDWVKNELAGKLPQLPEGWRICGENLFAKHSIHYRNLKSYFLAFSIWNEKNECLSWDDTVEWCNLLEIQYVQVLDRGPWNEDVAKMFAQVVEADPEGEIEGFVVRLADSFKYDDFNKSVAKMVRANHVQTSKHWMTEEIIRNELADS